MNFPSYHPFHRAALAAQKRKEVAPPDTEEFPTPITEEFPSSNSERLVLRKRKEPNTPKREELALGESAMSATPKKRESASLKRKQLEPTPPPTPKRQEREHSFISISSDENQPTPSYGYQPAPYYEHQPAPYYGNQPASPDEDVPAARIDSSPVLCQEQQALVNLIMSGKNVFFTGSAGCGKSTVLKAAIRQLQAQGKTVVVTAPTGIAALNVGGMTIHTYMGWLPSSNAWSLEGLKRSMQKKKEGSNSKNQTGSRIRKTDVLDIDEISMVENNLLSRMEACIRHVREMYEGDVPWGNLQLIVTGDFCQLPPVKPFEHCWLCGDARTPYRKKDGRGRSSGPPRRWPVDHQGRMKCNNGHGPWTE